MSFFRSLSGRLLLVTIAVVMIVEIIIFVPSVARYRLDYLTERVRRAEIAALTVLAAPDGMIHPELEKELLHKSETLNVVVGRDGIRQLVLVRQGLGPVMATYDLRDPPVTDLVLDALNRTISAEEGIIRVVAYAPADMGQLMEVTIESAPLRAAMRDYGLRILNLSMVISVITAVMIFLVMRWVVVRPITQVTDNVTRFSENPEDPSRVIRPTSRVGEIADAERALAQMQTDVLAALKTKARLASLGEAVAKISHDLRNILTTTHLLADRLGSSNDPIVARTGPKLIASLDRAISLCQSTMAYGKADEAPPEPKHILLADLIDEVVDGLSLMAQEQVSIDQCISPGLVVVADPEHLHRVFGNIARNAIEAIRATGKNGTITISATEDQDIVEILLADNGPGMPAKAIDHIFKPFQGSTRREGTGLGLAIASELITAHGGTIELISSTTAGTTFRIRLPRQGHVAPEARTALSA